MSTPSAVKGYMLGLSFLAAIVAVWVGAVLYQDHLVSEDSAQRALFVDTADLLEMYYQEHDEYPDSLDNLPLIFSDGADESTLALLEYESRGEDYVLKTTSVWTGRVFQTTGTEYRVEFEQWASKKNP